MAMAMAMRRSMRLLDEAIGIGMYVCVYVSVSAYADVCVCGVMDPRRLGIL